MDDQLEGQITFTDLESFDAILNEMNIGGAKMFKVKIEPNKLFDEEFKFESIEEATKFITSVMLIFDGEVDVYITKEEKQC